jgi:hypothetical protein
MLLATETLKPKVPCKGEEVNFNYSLSGMKKALSSKKNKVPPIKDVTDLESWLNS